MRKGPIRIQKAHTHNLMSWCATSAYPKVEQGNKQAPLSPTGIPTHVELGSCIGNVSQNQMASLREPSIAEHNVHALDHAFLPMMVTVSWG